MATLELVAKRRSSTDTLDEWGSEVWMEGDKNPSQIQQPPASPLPPVQHTLRAESEDTGIPGDSETELQTVPSREDLTTKRVNVDPKMGHEALSQMSHMSSSTIQMGDVELEQELKIIDENNPYEEEIEAAAIPSPPACTYLNLSTEGDVERENEPPPFDDKEENTFGSISVGEVSSALVPQDQSSSDSLGTQELTPKGNLDDKNQTIPQNTHHGTKTGPSTFGPLRGDIFRSESAFDGVESQSVDYKPLDISLARKQWVKLDSSSTKPPLPQLEQPSSMSRSSSCGHLAELTQPQDAVTYDVQQGEQLLHSPIATVRQQDKHEFGEQQVLKGATPTQSLATVTREPANPVEAGVVVGEQARGGDRHTGGERGQTESRLSGAAVEAERPKKEHSVKEGFKSVQKDNQKGQTRTNPGLKSRDNHRKTSRMELGGDLFDDSQSDSGVSADFSPGSTMDFHTTTPDSPTSLIPPPSNETPIEKEIRRALEREQSLRKSRGLQVKAPTQEYVEIPQKKPFLSQSLPSRPNKSLGGKERQLAGKIMQKEINVESQREDVLVQLGKVRGSYYKGTVRQLKERKKLFEVFQDNMDMSLMLSPTGKTPSWASVSDLSIQDTQGDDVSFVSDARGSLREREQSLELMRQSPSVIATGPTYTPPGAPRSNALSESTWSQITILENQSHMSPTALPHQPPPAKLLSGPHNTSYPADTPALTVVDSAFLHSSSNGASGERRTRPREDGREAKTDEGKVKDVPNENPFFKLRASLSSQDKVEQDIREARERDEELRRQRSSLYGGGDGGPAKGVLQETPFCPSPPLPQQKGQATLDQIPVTVISWTPSVTPPGRQSLGKLGVWPPPQSDECQHSHCESQGLQSPRTPRQKTPLLQRWESGQVMNSHGAEEDD
ncbi:hypothetical protein UPYG_G00064130 [Umbra pygmaea]|uniref:A-kinase anchor protein 2 C-terminal domain-containing protein n=1 Tax=Umbra pygmaea TaxID=75934 RepID=A0ABD0XA75_UMBPY